MTIGIVALLASLTACGGVRGLMGEFGDLLRLQQQLQQQTGQNDIKLNLTNHDDLNIGLVNSPWKDLPALQKKAKSLELARLAYSDDPHRASLTTIGVTFETDYDIGSLHYANGSDSFEFGISDFAHSTPGDSVQPGETGH